MLLVPKAGAVLAITTSNLVMAAVAVVRAVAEVKAEVMEKKNPMRTMKVKSQRKRRRKKRRKRKKVTGLGRCPLVMKILCPPVCLMHGPL